MKTIRLVLTITLFAFVATTVSAQKLKVTKGKIPSFSGEKTVLVEFAYNDMTVGKMTEAKYVAEKVKEKNEEEAGLGDQWKKDWIGNREGRFEGKFLNLFNKQVKDKGLKASTSTDKAKYKMLVRTTHTEPGFNVGVVRKPAHVNLEITISEIESGDSKATIVMKKNPGADAWGFDFDVGKRIQESYAKGGKSLGKHFKKKVLK